MFDIDDMA